MSDAPTSVWTVVVAGAIALATGGLSAFVTWLVAQRPGKAAEVTSEAAWLQAMDNRFRIMTEAQVAHEKRLTEYILRLETAVSGMSQHLLELEDTLRKQGADIPPRPEHAWPPAGFHVIPGGKS